MSEVCRFCGHSILSAYPAGGDGPTLRMCVRCGLSKGTVHSGFHEVMFRGHRIILSGEQLLNPGWYIRHNISTTSVALAELEKLEVEFVG